jgi:hypothetical protein
MHVSLTQQVQQVEDTYELLAQALGEAATADLFRRSVFFVSIGSNDFIHYYLRNVSGVQMRYLPWEFNQLLVNAVRQEIKVNFLFPSLFCLCSIARLHLIVLVLFIVARIGVLCIISKGCSIRKTSLTNRVNQENSSSSCNRS